MVTLFFTLMASVKTTIASLVAVVNSSKSAWDARHTTYARRSRTRVFISMINLLSFYHRISSHYFHLLSDGLATASAPLSNLELIVKILSGLGSEFREISTAVHSCDMAISYEKLFEKLLDHEFFLRQEDAKKLSNPITAAVAKYNNNELYETINY